MKLNYFIIRTFLEDELKQARKKPNIRKVCVCLLYMGPSCSGLQLERKNLFANFLFEKLKKIQFYKVETLLTRNKVIFGFMMNLT